MAVKLWNPHGTQMAPRIIHTGPGGVYRRWITPPPVQFERYGSAAGDTSRPHQRG